jgi:hypothetical protein
LCTELSDEKIALLGAIQSLFEGSMYTFVFLWTPALSPNDEDIPHGFIFATFMLSSMLGSSIASRLLARKLKVEGYMQIVFSISAITLVLPVVASVRYSVITVCLFPAVIRLLISICCNVNSFYSHYHQLKAVACHLVAVFSFLASAPSRHVLAYSGHQL